MTNPTVTAFDPSLYTRAPVFSLAEGIALARALAATAPRGMPATVTRALDRLSRRSDQAQAALLDRQREQGQLSDESTHLLDQEMDAAFSGLRQRLEGYASLPAAHYPAAARAAELLTELFGSDGLKFLQESYPAQWTAMDTLLKRIHKDGLTGELDALCGPEFLTHIRKLLPRYEQMVHAVLSRETGSGQNLLEERHSLGRAIAAYATAICATVDEDEPKTVERARTALRPLESQRQANSGRRVPSASEPPPSPTSPSPTPPSP